MCVSVWVWVRHSHLLRRATRRIHSSFLSLSLPRAFFNSIIRSPYSIIYPERSSPLRESSFSLYFPSLSKRMLSCLLFTALVLLLLPLLAIDSFCPSVDLFLVAK